MGERLTHLLKSALQVVLNRRALIFVFIRVHSWLTSPV